MMKIGKYTLLKKLATGGMAEIFLARQDGPAGFQKILVIKRILPHLAEDERFVTMFLNEARLAALLNHPNVVTIYDLGEDDGSYFLAMEYIHGRSLDQLLARCQALRRYVPLEICARIMADACVGLDHAHKFKSSDGTPLNLVHRDVSPQNILVTFGGLVKVVDFGVAKAAINRGRTQTGAVKGKYAYMSPEQIAGAPLDCRSDVFALGVVLFELATGNRPFGEQSDLLAVTAILNEAPQDARRYVPDFPSTLEQIILRSLEKEKDRRYRDAHEMQLDLERFIRAQGKFVTAGDVAAWLEELFGEEAKDDLALRAAEMAPLPSEDPTDVTESLGSLPQAPSVAGAEPESSVMAQMQPTLLLPDLDSPPSGAQPHEQPPADATLLPVPDPHPAAVPQDAAARAAERPDDGTDGPGLAELPPPLAATADLAAAAGPPDDPAGDKPTVRLEPMVEEPRVAPLGVASPASAGQPVPAAGSMRQGSGSGAGVLGVAMVVGLVVLLLAGLGTGGYLLYGWLGRGHPEKVGPGSGGGGPAVVAATQVPATSSNGSTPGSGDSAGKGQPSTVQAPDAKLPGPGLVFVQADSQAVLYVDGKLIGKVQLDPLTLPAGPHVIRAVLPEGRAPLQQTVLVVPNGMHKVVLR